MTSPKETDKTDATGGDRQTGEHRPIRRPGTADPELIGRAGSAGVSDLAGQLGVQVDGVAARRIAGSTRIRRTGAGRATTGSVSQWCAWPEPPPPILDLATYGQDVCKLVAAATAKPPTLRCSTARRPSTSSKHWAPRASRCTPGSDRRPPHATSSGKVLLSALTTAQLRDLLPARPAAYTDNTVTDRTRLIDELGVVAERGWAVADEELGWEWWPSRSPCATTPAASSPR